MSKIYVTPHIKDWAVKQEGLKSMISVHHTKEEAIKAARQVATIRNAEIILLKRDGSIDNLTVYSISSLTSGNKRSRMNNQSI